MITKLVLLNQEIEDAFDHKNLNIEVEEFKSLNPTASHVGLMFFNFNKFWLNTGFLLPAPNYPYMSLGLLINIKNTNIVIIKPKISLNTIR